MSKTVLLPDGYNGDKILMYSEPIAYRRENLVKLKCAEPGKSHLTQWVDKDYLAQFIKRGDCKDGLIY